MANTPKSAAPAAGARGGRTVEELESDIDKLREDIAQLTRHLRDAGENSIRGAKRAAAEGVEQLRAQGEAAMDGLRDKSGAIEAQIESRVREKPITSLAVAMAVGYVLAMITRR